MLAGESSEEVVRLGARELFALHAPFVRRFVARMGVLAHDLDDITQEVFLIAHRQGGYVYKGARPTTWLAEIALRVTLAHQRTKRRGRAHDGGDLEALASRGPTPFDSAVAGESLARVQSALDALDADQRAIFVLFELEGESCDAIAHALGLPVGTVHSRLHYARKTFQKHYERLALYSRFPPLDHARGEVP
jgi:RNA polymerase sigma-70 factor, ECF subfamily